MRVPACASASVVQCGCVHTCFVHMCTLRCCVCAGIFFSASVHLHILCMCICANVFLHVSVRDPDVLLSCMSVYMGLFPQLFIHTGLCQFLHGCAYGA